MRKRGLCCRQVSVCLSVTLVDSIQRLKIMSNFLFRLVARHSSFLTLSAGTKFQGEPFSGGTKYEGVGKFLTEIAIYLRNGTR